MARVIFLDAGPLGMISHPRPANNISTWLAELLADGNEVVIPEIAEYEVCRELLRARKTKGIHRLDQLKTLLRFVPIDRTAMLRAAEFWA
jgi:toxin FitB